MRSALTALLAVAAVGAAASPANAEPPLTFLLAGQSNMVGLAKPIPVETPDSNVVALNPDNTWTPATDPLYQVGGVDPLFQANHDGGVGPAIAFGDAVAAATGRQVRLIQCAASGTGIQEWLPGYVPNGASDPPEYDPCIARVQSLNTTIDGVIFYQGETDAILPEWSAAWASRFATFVTDIRRDLGATVPIVFAQIGSGDGLGHGTSACAGLCSWDTVVAQQASVALPGVTMIQTSDLLAGPDHVHLTVDSYRVVGARFAQAWLAMPAFQPASLPSTVNASSVSAGPVAAAAAAVQTPLVGQPAEAIPAAPAATPPVAVTTQTVLRRSDVAAFRPATRRPAAAKKRMATKGRFTVIGHQGLRVFLAGQARG